MMHDFAKNSKKKRRIVLNDTAFYGLEGSRTLDLSDANRTLSQLSYGPTYEIIPRPGQRYILYHKIRHGQGQFSILCKLRKKHRRIVRRCFFPTLCFQR